LRIHVDFAFLFIVTLDRFIQGVVLSVKVEIPLLGDLNNSYQVHIDLADSSGVCTVLVTGEATSQAIGLRVGHLVLFSRVKASGFDSSHILPCLSVGMV
jgi:hypothetical protein